MAKSTFATIGILALLLLSIGVVSAAAVPNMTLTLDDKGTASNKISGDSGTVHSFTINLNHSNNAIGEVYISWTGSTGFFTDIASIANNQNNGTVQSYTFEVTLPSSGIATKTITAHIYNSTNISQEFGTKTKTINYNVTSTSDDDPDPTPTGDTWCDEEFSGEVGTLQIKNFYIDYIGSGDDEEWEPLDEIIIEVDIKNTDSDDRVDDIIVEIKILDSNDNDVTSDFDFEDEEDKLGRISKKKTETAIFTITELPTDVEEDTYRIYVRAYDDDDEDAQCVSKSRDFNDNSELFHEFEVVKEDEAVIVKENDFMAEAILASCGDKNIQISFPVYNIGDDEEDKVLVQLHNSELGIDEFYVIDSLRSGKGKNAFFSINIPEELSKSRYSLDILTFFAYDDDEDELERASYDENSNDIDRDFSIRLEILSCEGPGATININLESETVVGKQVVIKATITNNGEDNDFIISVSDLESWAESINIVPLTTSINEGESAEIIITFIPTSTGKHSFKINANSDSNSAIINIKEESSLFSGISNTMLYTIIAGIVIVLILIFITLIVKVSRKQVKPQF